MTMGAILCIALCTVIGALVGHALIGLAGGLIIVIAANLPSSRY
jgi:hypothetical protein